MKLITLAALIGSAVAAETSLIAEDDHYTARTFFKMLKMGEANGHSQADMKNMDHEQLLEATAGGEQKMTAQQFAVSKDYHKWNFEMDHHDRIAHHWTNFKAAMDADVTNDPSDHSEGEPGSDGYTDEDDDALVEEDEASLMDDILEEGVQGWRRRRRRRWGTSTGSANRRRRRTATPSDTTPFSTQYMYSFVDLMYNVKTSGHTGSQNYYDDGNCKSTGDDMVCLHKRKTASSVCALVFRGSDSASDWLGYLDLFTSSSDVEHGDSSGWHIDVPNAFNSEYNSISGHLASFNTSGCNYMYFVGSSLGGALAEIAFENYKEDFSTTRVITLDAPKIASNNPGCRSSTYCWRGWYEHSLISAAPMLDMPFGRRDYYHVTSATGSYMLSPTGGVTAASCTDNPSDRWAATEGSNFWSTWNIASEHIGTTAKYHSVTHWHNNVFTTSTIRRRRRS